MAVGVKCVLVVVVIFLLVWCGQRHVSAVTLSPCGHDKTAEFIKGKTDNTFYCSGVQSSHNAFWNLQISSSGFPLGSCPPLGRLCTQGQFGDAATPSRTSSTESSLVIDTTKLTNSSIFNTATLSCADSNSRDNCQIDLVEPARGNCSLRRGEESKKFHLSGQCNLQPGASSSRGRYGCMWFRQGKTSPEVHVNLTADNYRENCRMSDIELPVDNGQYTYTVTLIPGRQNVTAGSVAVERPGRPYSSDCGAAGFVAENRAFNCTCKTDNIGVPQGRLQWVKVGDHSSLVSGIYGDRSLQVPQVVLQREDHQKTLFRCLVDWIELIKGDDLSFNVGYPPTQPKIGLNNSQDNQTVKELSTVQFRCLHSDGRPEPTLTLMKLFNGTQLDTEKKILKHNITARCEDTGTYVCQADNGIGDVARSAPRHLAVQCSPRGGDENLGELNFPGQPSVVKFEVTAYPVPDRLTFSYLGPTAENTGVSNPTKLSDISISGKCSAKRNKEYRSECTVTVTNVTSARAAGFYRVTVTNSVGHTQFRFKILKIKYKDRDTAPSTGNNLTVIAGGGGAAAAAVMVIAVVVVVIRNKQRGQDDGKLRRVTDARLLNGRAKDADGGGRREVVDSFIEIENLAYETCADAERTRETATSCQPRPSSDDGPQTHSPQSSAAEAPDNLYAIVDKKRSPLKNKTSTTTTTAAPTNVSTTGSTTKDGKGSRSLANSDRAGPQAEDVYAVVEKTKKKTKKNKEKKKESGAQGGKSKIGKGGAKQSQMTEEGNIYNNTHNETEKDMGKQPECPDEQEEEATGRELNADGLLYTSVDFTHQPSSGLKFKPSGEDQGVIYSSVDGV